MCGQAAGRAAGRFPWNVVSRPGGTGRQRCLVVEAGVERFTCGGPDGESEADCGRHFGVGRRRLRHDRRLGGAGGDDSRHGGVQPAAERGLPAGLAGGRAGRVDAGPVAELQGARRRRRQPLRPVHDHRPRPVPGRPPRAAARPGVRAADRRRLPDIRTRCIRPSNAPTAFVAHRPSTGCCPSDPCKPRRRPRPDCSPASDVRGIAGPTECHRRTRAVWRH